MNKIFKKVWNRKRRCFVAVSEVMTAAGQSAGKAAGIVITAAFVGYIAPSEALVVNGDHRVSDMPGVSYNIQHNQDASVTVNGNFYDDSTVGFYIAEKNKDGGYQTAELIVNGSAYIQFPKIVEHPNQPTAFTIAHVHYSDSNGTFSIRDDLHVDNISHINTSNFYSDTKGTATSSLIVGGTAYIYGNINSPSTSNHDGQYAISDHSINNLDLFGNYFGVWTNNTQYKRTIQNAVLRTGSSFIQDTSGLANSYDTVNFGNLTIENGAVLSNSNFLTIGENSQNGISVGQTLTLKGGTVSNRTVLTQVGGSVNVTAGSYDFGTLNKSNGVLGNAATLVITNFNQSNGTASNSGNLTIGNADLGGSLTNTGTLSLTGTVTSRGNLTSSGTLNNRGNWTETAHYAISGSLNNSGAVNFQNGFEFAANGRLNSSGTLQTNNAANIFDSLGSQGQTALSTVSLEAVLPEETKTALTDLFRHYVPGSVAQSLIDHASLTGGKVIVTGVNLTTTQRDDLVQAFKAKFFLPDASTSAVSQQC
ncbi:ESPR-type extended signal peptide-containing protein [Parasutterella excrementihominis]|uniref:ESPR-type extended signal peptide-containing protein n=1 Tax=Parasutterella excrementihominis TaxID=487175 RepID=UPI003AF18E4A